MPFGKWSNFEDCVKDFISKGKPEERAKRICGALRARLGEEGAGQFFSWEGEVTPQRDNLIGGRALHPIKTFHPEEWPGVRVYLEEELRKAAGSLAGAPLLLDHVYPLDGEVLEASYVDGAVEYVADLRDEEVLGCVKDGTISHCSVEYEWDNLERVDGVAPRGITFTGLSLLKDCEPGDRETSVGVWEAIVKRLREAAESSVKRRTGEAPDVEAALEAVNLTLTELSERMERHCRILKTRVDTLEKLVDSGSVLGEAVIDPAASNAKEMVSRAEILAELKRACYERVPKHWSYGAYRQNLRLKDLIRRLEEGEEG